MKQFNNSELIQTIIQTSILAGKRIMEVYNTDFEVDYKDDESPLTKADREANTIICDHLQKIGIPILSEEGKQLPYSKRKEWKRLWIVDPLDGTKEFVKRNGEFTVNIALIENNSPIMGVIFCPTLKILYIASHSLGGSFKITLQQDWQENKPQVNVLMKMKKKLPLKTVNKPLIVAASRSHLSDETRQFVKSLEKKVGGVTFISKGSSLKLCMVAEGNADMYPRFAPTSEWDTAAGQAIVEQAGGSVFIKGTKKPMIYNKENILNPWFLAIRNSLLNKIEI